MDPLSSTCWSLGVIERVFSRSKSIPEIHSKTRCFKMDQKEVPYRMDHTSTPKIHTRYIHSPVTLWYKRFKGIICHMLKRISKPRIFEVFARNLRFIIQKIPNSGHFNPFSVSKSLSENSLQSFFYLNSKPLLQ